MLFTLFLLILPVAKRERVSVKPVRGRPSSRSGKVHMKCIFFPVTPGVIPAGTMVYHLPAKKGLRNTHACAQTYRRASAAAAALMMTVR